MDTTEPTTARTLRVPPADPAVAAAHLAVELALDADPDDVWQDIEHGTADGCVLVETRGPSAFAAARIAGAVNLPYWDLDEVSTAGLDRDLVYVCYCESFQCNAATKGALRLAELGFRVKRLAGGITTWRAAGYPVVSDSGASGVACAC